MNEIIELVYNRMRKTNYNNFNLLSMDEQGETCIRIARAIILLKEESNG